jgi:hypothetical protein
LSSPAAERLMTASWLWAVFTVIAAFTQTVRNATQRELTGSLGTVGATHVRFLFGFSFAFVFLAGLLVATSASLPRPGLAFWPWVLVGAFAQVAATALMLAAMGGRSFVVTIAYTKTEPIQVAIFGLTSHSASAPARVKPSAWCSSSPASRCLCWRNDASFVEIDPPLSATRPRESRDPVNTYGESRRSPSGFPLARE